MKYLLQLFIFIVCITVIFPQTINANEDELVRVRLENHIGNPSQLDIHIKGEYVTLDPTLPIKKGGIYTLTATDGSMHLNHLDETYQLQDSLVLIPKEYDREHVIYINERPYLGAIEFRLEGNNTIRPVNQLPLEDYLKGVVPFEVYPSWGLETLKAQALAARTYATTHINEEIDDTIKYQVYGGYTWKENTTKAVEQTKGEVITYNNRLISAFYSASNGGVTESNANVWGGKRLSYFPIKKDPYDPVHSWEFKLHETQIDLEQIEWDDPNWWENLEEKNKDIIASVKQRIAKNSSLDQIKILSVPKFELSNQRLASERRTKGSITIDYLQRLFDGTVLFRQFKMEDIPLNKIRPMIGGTRFKSYLIDSLEKQAGIYTMKGRGYGHGVGMSQWGAQVMGENGHSYRDIIDFYYPGTEVSSYKDIQGG
ncbi:SpoIID/LytB domain-containing protein [Aquibacillus sediminis]|uniref:SpoIID/LytB domain-containing protein n=1 Tax=Aquibacillus sediminis TaxID=2574734 RepID=UPI001107F8C0|nr:SpoIID/LytB domain-containing protein [Aquibacillus sediminis]